MAISTAIESVSDVESFIKEYYDAWGWDGRSHSVVTDNEHLRKSYGEEQHIGKSER